MTKVTHKASPRPNSRTPSGKRFFRWKIISYQYLYTPEHYGQPGGNRYTFLGLEPVGTWQRAVMRHGGAYEDEGFHTYRFRRDAENSSFEGELTKVEVAGLIARGIGDGSANNSARVETWLWIKVPRAVGEGE